MPCIREVTGNFRRIKCSTSETPSQVSVHTNVMVYSTSTGSALHVFCGCVCCLTVLVLVNVFILSLQELSNGRRVPFCQKTKNGIGTVVVQIYVLIAYLEYASEEMRVQTGATNLSEGWRAEAVAPVVF